MTTVSAAGTTFEVVEQGRGEPVVFIHGGFSDVRTWKRQVPAFAARYRAIAYSRRYARPNPEIAEGAADAMERHIEDLIALLPGLGAAPAHLVGSSWGASIALHVAIRRPDLVRSLTLNEPPLIPLVTGSPPRPLRLLRSLLRRPRLTLSVLRFAARYANPAGGHLKAGRMMPGIETFTAGVLGREIYLRLPEERRQQMRDNWMAMAGQARLDGGFAPIGEAEIRSVRVPTLRITGSLTPKVLLDLDRLLGELMPHARHAVVAEASHLTHEEQPERYNAAILGFLDGLRPADRPFEALARSA